VVRTVETIRDALDVVTARELGARIVQAVQAHVGSHPQFDDIALVCFGRAGGRDEADVGTDERPTRLAAGGE
jgi:hypothetical protein